MGDRVTLTMAMGEIDRTQPLIEGRVRPEGINPVGLTLRPPERHRRMLEYTEFDVCEMSLGSCLAIQQEGYPFTALPAFPHREFRHSYYFINTESQITEPKDLERNPSAFGAGKIPLHCGCVESPRTSTALT